MAVKQISKESKEERFKRIAGKRVNEILDKIRLLENCANTKAYSYSEQQINKIFSEINKQLRFAKAKFDGVDGNKKRPFEL